MYVCIFTRLIYLQVTRNMELLLLFTHTITSTVVGISLTGCIQPTIAHLNKGSSRVSLLKYICMHAKSNHVRDSL